MIKMKQWVSLALCAVFLLAALALPIAAADIPENIKTSKVLDDLENMHVEGRIFDEAYYPQSRDANYIRILSFLEYGYDYGGDQKDYGIYIYVYNPGLKNFATEGKIQLAAGKTEDTIGLVRKYTLQEVSRSNDYRFIKYKIANLQPAGASKALYDIVARDERIYQVSGIELKLYGSSGNATEYETAGTYKYTGFMKGHCKDPKAESTLLCDAEDLLTIELDIRGATWRSETSSAGLGHKNEIASVYFGIDNEILDNYGYLYRVEGEFYENKIGSIVTDSEELYNAYKNVVGKKVEELEGYDPETGVSDLYPSITDEAYSVTGETSKVYHHALGFNVQEMSINFAHTSYYDKLLPFVPYFYHRSVFASEGEVDVTPEEHKQNIDNVGLYPLEPVEHREYSITLDDKFDLSSYKGNHEWYEYFFESGGGWLWWDIPEEDYKDISPIVEFDKNDLYLTDTQLSAKLFLADNYIRDFRNYTASQNLKNKTVHLLRFAVNDYCSSELLNGYYAEQTYYDDFDILRLTFMDEYKNKTPFVVNSDPTDIVGGLENTPDYDLEESVDKAKEFIDQFMPFLKKLIGFFMVVAIIVFIIRIIVWVSNVFSNISLKRTIRKDVRHKWKSSKYEEQELAKIKRREDKKASRKARRSEKKNK